MSDTRTALLLVMDGVGDRLLPDRGNRTPLQIASTPNFDTLARQGQSALMNVIGPGITPGSDAAHLALFGYDPVETYPGRGPLEALGAGLDSKPGSVAFRSNFATVDDDFVVVDRRAGREFTEEEHAALQAAIDGMVIDDVKVHFVATVEHRGALVLEGPGLYADISEVDPHETGKRVLISKPLRPDAKKTADVVNKLMRQVHLKLRDLPINKDRVDRGLPPANAILVRGAGRHEEVASLEEKYHIRSAVIAGGALYIGTAKFVGMEHVTVEGQTGTIDTNFDNIAQKTIECVNSGYNYVFVHIKATDNASHDGNTDEKILAIERTDTMLGKIIDAVSDKIVIAVTGDHSTPLSTREHACDPVPIVFWSDFIRPDDVERFSEIDAAGGALHTIRGLDVMPLLLGYSGYIEKFGA
ncbi:MAG: 2,3-bisphosphoglycerate-independent phosphoglycerate mutase [Candidatus Thorarchaeota archaeon]|nr:MAG: 2,3-bisphosphoglycerate-independent phosphoglycerate mutase [Candidatus Thorarchaeota archaeon]RLI57518.1 MAG: 2,3-bisphosphoglycerate-independent phosphoglycerate mutase [Candidatus Thorarchaeota archaeon]